MRKLAIRFLTICSLGSLFFTFSCNKVKSDSGISALDGTGVEDQSGGSSPQASSAQSSAVIVINSLNELDLKKIKTDQRFIYLGVECRMVENDYPTLVILVKNVELIALEASPTSPRVQVRGLFFDDLITNTFHCANSTTETLGSFEDSEFPSVNHIFDFIVPKKSEIDKFPVGKFFIARASSGDGGAFDAEGEDGESVEDVFACIPRD
ncbi:MAG: hypothetical protein IPJ71_02885 [Bdellovibrionales bacterium]|nr:hypothetical protein [Bdellovibrionales bacterium]